MSAHHLAYIDCDVHPEDDAGDEDRPMPGLFGVDRMENYPSADVARWAARKVGWHRSRGRDICPDCWDAGRRAPSAP